MHVCLCISFVLVPCVSKEVRQVSISVPSEPLFLSMIAPESRVQMLHPQEMKSPSTWVTETFCHSELRITPYVGHETHRRNNPF